MQRITYIVVDIKHWKESVKHFRSFKRAYTDYITRTKKGENVSLRISGIYEDGINIIDGLTMELGKAMEQAKYFKARSEKIKLKRGS